MYPQLILFIGPMFSSKSSKLIACADKYKYKKKNVVLFKPKEDNRYSEDEIVTHSGLKIPSIIINSNIEIIDYVSKHNPDVIAFDEFFMIPDSGITLYQLFKEGKIVIGSGLDLSSELEPIKEVKFLLPFATRIKKCKAVCTQCPNAARYTMSKFQKQTEVVVGGADKYEPRCYLHHPGFFNRKIK
jgi:thymidine kinase